MVYSVTEPPTPVNKMVSSIIGGYLVFGHWTADISVGAVSLAIEMATSIASEASPTTKPMTKRPSGGGEATMCLWKMFYQNFKGKTGKTLYNFL